MFSLRTRLTLTLLAGTALTPPASASDLPAGASVAYGSVGISTPSANAMAIRQTSPTAIVNWQAFSIGQNSRVDINQPSASSALLNRVTGSTTSTIAGQLNANGRVYLVNPNGIVITKTGAVRADGGFVGSTLGITDEDFKAGRLKFGGNGQSASIVNEGSIEIGPGGYAALIGGKVDNSGLISVPMGRVGLGAGEAATLDLSGDGFLQVTVPSKLTTGDTEPLIQHSGRITTPGGRVEMRAATARDVARQAINLSGVVEARSVSGRSGAIVLGGGAGGRVTVSGKLDVSAPKSKTASTTPLATGGKITITGADIALKGAELDASGTGGGGTIRIGGDLQGKGDLQRADTTRIDAATTIRADATETGNGGSVVVWSDQKTSFEGLISARGGTAGGNGGFAEVSGKAILDYSGRTDLIAPFGRFGTLLLDPFNVFIEATGTSVSGGTYSPTSNDSVISAATLVGALSSANVTITTGTLGTQAGDITVGAPLSWTAGTTLTLNAAWNVVIGEAITAQNGGLTLEAGGTITTPVGYARADGSFASSICSPGPCTAHGAIDVGTFTLTSGDWVQNSAQLPAFAAVDFRIENGSFLRVLGGNGTTANPYQITDVYGLQGIGSRIDYLGAHYVLANDIDARVTSGWNGEAGFVPIGDGNRGSEFFGGANASLFATLACCGGTPFSGSFDGQNHSITGLTINRPEEVYIGLFGGTENASIRNVSLRDLSVVGYDWVGGLVGWNGTGSTVTQSHASGMVHATGEAAWVGGLIGENAGSVTASRTDVRVSANFGNAAGGLVGYNQGTITQSYATGSVTADSGINVGGLVGWNQGTIAQTYASGAVSTPIYEGGGNNVGGLVGWNDGPGAIIQDSYARGAVTAPFGSAVGGLVGLNGTSDGGGGTIERSYSTGTVNALNGTAVGGLVGDNYGTVTQSYWDTMTSLQESSAGGTSLTTAQFQNTTGFMQLTGGSGGWDFMNVWAPPSPGYYPELYALSPVVRLDVSNVSRTYGTSNPTLTGSLYGGPGRYVFGNTGDSINVAGALTTTANASSGVGTYAIMGESAVTSAQGVTYRVVSFDGTLTVTPAPLTITANNQARRWSTPIAFAGTEFTATGLVSGDQITSVQLASAGATGLYPLGGRFAIFAGDAQGTGLENYDISYNPGILTVLPSGTSRTETPFLAPPDSFVPINNPTDVIDLQGGGSGGSGGGPIIGTGRDVAAADATLAFVERVSNDLERQVAECEQVARRNSREYIKCVGDALDQYASALDSRILQLPPAMRGVSAVIREAARKVRTARTVDEARAAVRTAVTEVRKAIALLRADEPAVARIQVRQGNAIATALQSVETRLAKAVGL